MRDRIFEAPGRSDEPKVATRVPSLNEFTHDVGGAVCVCWGRGGGRGA